MDKILEEMLDYLNNASDIQLEEDWAEMRNENQGILAKDYIDTFIMPYYEMAKIDYTYSILDVGQGYLSEDNMKLPLAA